MTVKASSFGSEVFCVSRPKAFIIGYFRTSLVRSNYRLRVLKLPDFMPRPPHRQGKETLEQFDEPFAGHSDSGDNGQCDKAGDEAVFDGGGAALVAQKLSEALFSLEL